MLFERVKGFFFFFYFFFCWIGLLMFYFRDLTELFQEFEYDLEEVNTKMAILKERNKKKENENNEEFHLQQDMSLLPGINFIMHIVCSFTFLFIYFIFVFRFTYFCVVGECSGRSNSGMVSEKSKLSFFLAHFRS